jgi:hypothetical protein
MSRPLLSRSFKLLREGFDRLLWEYWLAFKDKAWEVFWGPTVLGIVFGLVTLWYSPARPWFLLYVLAVVFLTGYYLWRTDHIRLIPRLRAKAVLLQETPTAFEHIRGIYVQVKVVCLTEASVSECRGHLVRVCKKDYPDQDQWEETEMNESVYLAWSLRGDKAFEPLTLEPGVEPRLNICHWASNSPQIVPAIDPLPNRAAQVFNSSGIFRFDIRITSKDCAPIDFSVSVTLDRRRWNEPIVELIG